MVLKPNDCVDTAWGYTSSYRTTMRRGALREDLVWVDQRRWQRLRKHSRVENNGYEEAGAMVAWSRAAEHGRV